VAQGEDPELKPQYLKKKKKKRKKENSQHIKGLVKWHKV
jgi:hypothetical protein